MSSRTPGSRTTSRSSTRWPATSPLYDVPLGDESGYVIEGSATIELVDSGETVSLAAGQLYSFKKGTLTRWTIHEPFTKFVVVNDGPPLAPGEPVASGQPPSGGR